jgi:pimeloyl-ACP methyl ester carboxylesterase
MTHTVPPVRYARSGDVNIAYQALDGDGPDLIYVSGWVSHLDMMWEDPYKRRFLERLADFGRLIVFDKRGVGLSDRVSLDNLPTLEERMDDMRVVLDSVGSEKAFLFGHSEGSVMSALYAATHPSRTRGLILFGAYATRKPAPDYPWAPEVEDRQRELLEQRDDWPQTSAITLRAPSMAGNAEFIDRQVRYLRSGASPAAAFALGVMNSEADIRDVLPAINTPTLLLHRVGDRSTSIGESRYIVDRIPGARLVELQGEDHLPWTDNYEDIVAEIEEFVTGTRTAPEPDRVLATVLFTDIVDSTKAASDHGDKTWREILDRHDQISLSEIERFRGRPVKGTGDGYLATFDGPARAVRCALSITDATQKLGIRIRSGLHAGEIELRGDDIGGIGVHIASRVSGKAGPCEVLVSRTVKDLVAGSGLQFTDRGIHSLKGVDDTWQLFSAKDG